ncbi:MULTISPECIES: chromate transporter [Gracilibacillus]|uniref:chromate transporter n=1 Tax=Gracilibacillus TaxID=74385 RepID=UPI000826B125|nr:MULTISPECIES: chromate transporter [Gracilibacillus]
MKSSWKSLGQIFLAFLKIAPATFGGGYAMIPLMEKEVVDKRKWMETKEISEIFAIAQSVPGAIAINSATFIGYRLAGVLGAVTAMVGIMVPTFLIVVALSILFIFVNDNPYVEAAFTGIRAAVVAMILYAAYKIGLTAIYDKTTLMIMIVTTLVLYLLQVHPVIVILGGIVVGIAAVKVQRWLGYATRLDREDK